MFHIRIVRQFTKFSIVGVTNTIVDFVIYLILTRLFDIFFIVATTISFIVAVSWSFYWNKRWTFRNKESEISKQYTKFFIVNLIGFLIHTSILYYLVVSYNWFDIYAKIAAIIIATLFNFLLSKFWAFENKQLLEQDDKKLV